MSDRYDKYKWLEMAFSEQVDRLNESYYCDKRDNQFFSIFITDYFLTDPTSTDNYPDNPYSPQELNTLAERIKRLELNDELIVAIPKLKVDERIQMMEEFIASRPNLSNNNDLLKIIDAENGRTSLDFDNLLPSKEKEEWKQFKSEFIEQKVDTFCNLQNVDFDSASLWTDQKMTSVSLGLDDNENEQQLEQKKPWWKFW